MVHQFFARVIFFLTLPLTVLYFISHASAQTYCSVSANNAYEYINNVGFNTINLGNGISPNGYNNGSNVLLPPVQAGSNLDIRITPAYTGYNFPQYFMVGIDFNHDGDFLDPGEEVFRTTTPTASMYSATVGIPNSASGPTRVRMVMSYYQNDLKFCGHVTFGEFEDYTINFTPPTGGPTGEPVDTKSAETFMSARKHNLVCLNQQFGPHSANFVLTGTSNTNPPFKVIANAFYDYSLHFEPGVEGAVTNNGHWIISNVTVQGLPPGFSVPNVSVRPTSSSSVHDGRECVQVGSGGSSEYLMKWEMDGYASPGIQFNPIMHTLATPWTGSKRLLVLKTRHTNALPVNKQLSSLGGFYGSNSDPVPFLHYFTSAFESQSNGKLSLSYDVKEAQYVPPFSLPVAACGQSNNLPCAENVVRGALASVNITRQNFQDDAYDHTIMTFYKEMADAYQIPGTGVVLGSFSGQMNVYQNCAQCEWTSWAASGLDSLSLSMHEFTHGFGYGHNQGFFNVSGATPQNIPQGLMFPVWNPPFSKTPGNSLMGGGGSVRIHPLRRAWLGWLSDDNVKTITHAGEYEVFSDNDDFTMDPTKPTLLQILVRASDGTPRFVYVWVPNNNFTPAYAALGESQLHPQSAYTVYKNENNTGIKISTVDTYGGTTGSDYKEIYDYNPYMSNSDANVADHRATITPGNFARLNWTGTNLTILNVQRTGTRAVVRVTGTPMGPAWQNQLQRLDVNNDGLIQALDALIIINRLNANPSTQLVGFPNLANGDNYYDVNGDGIVTAVDSLQVINYLNSQ